MIKKLKPTRIIVKLNVTGYIANFLKKFSINV